MGSSHQLDEIGRHFLGRVGPHGSTVDELAAALGQSRAVVDALSERLAGAGFLTSKNGRLALTESGQMVVAGVPESWVPAEDGGQPPSIDVLEIARSMRSAWETHSRQRAAEERTARDHLLASTEEREAVVNLLSQAFTEGRLSSEELDDRTGRALAARTHGELDGVLEGLGGMRREVRVHVVRRIVFGVVAFLCSPVVFIGVMLLAFGTDVGDRVAGIVALAMLLPGLFALRRWAWPRA